MKKKTPKLIHWLLLLIHSIISTSFFIATAYLVIVIVVVVDLIASPSSLFTSDVKWTRKKKL